MKVYDMTLGLRCATLEDVATIVHEQFGLSFVPRTSSYLGGDYFAATKGNEEVFVHLNRDGEEVAEEDYADCVVLIQINSCNDANKWKAFLSQKRWQPPNMGKQRDWDHV